MKNFLLTILFTLSCFLAFSQNFTPGNLVVARYGDGVNELPTGTRITVPVFLDEYDLTGNKVQTLPMPVVKSEETRNRVLTGGVKDDLEGLITLSPNGHYLVAIGHNVPPGMSYARRQRTVGVITADGHINIKTAVKVNLGIPRCAITNNGMNLWIVGSGGGLKYKPINSSAKNEVVISHPPQAHNAVYIYNDQLYYTSNYLASANGPKIGVVGDGLPVDGKKNVNHLPGFPTNSRPGQMVMLDHDTSTPEPDLLYVTDRDKGDLQKWVYTGSVWEAKGAIDIAGTTDKISGITGNITGGDVVLYTNTSDAVLKFSDDNAISSTISEELNTPVVLATAPEHTIFRGIAFTPGTISKVHKKVSSSSRFADLIMEKTNLIREIKVNETYQRYPGVEETKLQYVSNRGVDIAVYFLKVNLKNPNTSIAALTPYDDTEFARQQITDMIRYRNESETRQVVAASNGDYFHWTGEPDGAVHKDGEIIKALPDRKYFFGIRNDGTAIIGDKRIYDNVKTSLEEVISGRFFLMHYGEIMTDHLRDTSIEPRTTVGLLSPEHVVFMWVDGRRPGYSSGLSLRDMAAIYDAIGATEAINLDGGGSTTFVMRSKDGTYELHNRPSDSSGERAVGNGLAVMMKSEVLKTKPAKSGQETATAQISIYPSPVEDHVNLFIEKEKASEAVTLQLTNSNGRNFLKMKGTINSINDQLNKELSSLERGIYIIKIEGEHGAYSSRLMKK